MCWLYIGFMVRAVHRMRALKNPSGLMRALLKCLSKKQFFFTTGVVETAKVEALTEKFVRLYPTIAESSSYRSAMRKTRQPVVDLFWWPLTPRGSWEFVLISDQRLPKEPKMQDARRRNQRITVLNGYYQCVRKPGDGWTWEMTDEHFAWWHRQLMRAVSKEDPQLVIDTANRMRRVVSMYKGARIQVLHLLGEAQRACKTKGKRDVKIPMSVPIMRFLPVYSNCSLHEQILSIKRETVDQRSREQSQPSFS